MKKFSLLTRQLWGKDNVEDGPAIRIEIIDKNERVLHRLTHLGQDVDDGNNTSDNFTMGISLPDDPEEQVPRASLEIGIAEPDPILLQMINDRKARDLKVKIGLYRQSDPTTPDYETITDIVGVGVTLNRISLNLGYRTLLEESSVRVRYSPDVAPALFDT